MLNEYRCTRVSAYPFGTPSEAMQGYYIRTYSEEQALAIMLAEGFADPNDKIAVELWRKNIGAIFEKQLAEGLIKL